MAELPINRDFSRKSFPCGGAGLLFILIFGALLTRPLPATDYYELPFSDQGGVISDTGGAIEAIVLHYDPDAGESLDPFYRDLFNVLPPGIRIEVLCPSKTDAEAFLESWEAWASRGRQLKVINVNCPISLWSRDRRIARQNTRTGQPAANYVPAEPLEYAEQKRNENRVVFSLVELGIAPNMLPTSLFLEGGNIVSNERQAFIGGNVLTDNAEQLDGAERTIRQELTRIAGRSVVLIQGEQDELPWDHVDMFLTPVDDKTVLVADPALAGIFFCSDESQNSPGEEWPEFVLDGSDMSEKRQKQFDAVADQVKALGYRVRRLPALVNTDNEWMITYNNVVMERREGRKIVYLPSYRISSLDDLASATYRELGFDVRPVDVSEIFEHGGALRCLVNVTRRQRLRPTGPRMVSRRSTEQPAIALPRKAG